MNPQVMHSKNVESNGAVERIKEAVRMSKVQARLRSEELRGY